MSLTYLVYVSQAERALDEEALAAILAESRAYNPAHGITGALLFVAGRDGNSGSFMQLLEGEKADVDTLRKRIFADSRHHTKVVIEQGPLETRTFADWSMAFRGVTAKALEAYPSFARLGEPDFVETFNRGDAKGALAFLNEFWNAPAL